MTLYPAGPLEKAITLANLAPVKPPPGIQGKMMVIGCLSAVAGAVVMYFYMKNQTKNSEADTQRGEA